MNGCLCLSLSYLARVEPLAELDVDVVIEEVGIALDALRQRRRGRRRHRVVEEAVEVHVVHALKYVKGCVILDEPSTG